MKKGILYDSAAKLAKLYLLIPFLIFSITWMKPLYALICCFGIGAVVYSMFAEKQPPCLETITRTEQRTLFVAFLLIAVWVGMSGIGCIVYQNDDHAWRNGMFELLVAQDWPVTMEYQAGGLPMKKGFSYYIGFWLPAACVGKLFGVNAGYKFQILWAILGIFLFYLILCKLLNRIALWPMILFIFFSGMDILGYYFTGKDLSVLVQTEHLEWWAALFQFSSFTTQLFWVFNQAVPAWLATMLFVDMEENKQIVFIWSLMLLNCTMPFAGLLPFVVYKVISSLPKKKQLKKDLLPWLKKIISLDNVVGGIISMISLLYLSKGGEMLSVGLIRLNKGEWLVYLVFLILEAGALWLSVLWAHGRNPMFYITLAWLALCPLLDLYGDKNFCMRASIPALAILFFYVTQALIKAAQEKKHKHFLLIILLLALGAVTPIHEFNRTIVNTFQVYVNEQETRNSLKQETVSFQDIIQNEYETTDAEKNFFFKYLSR